MCSIVMEGMVSLSNLNTIYSMAFAILLVNLRNITRRRKITPLDANYGTYESVINK